MHNHERRTTNEELNLHRSHAPRSSVFHPWLHFPTVVERLTRFLGESTPDPDPDFLCVLASLREPRLPPSAFRPPPSAFTLHPSPVLAFPCFSRYLASNRGFSHQREGASCTRHYQSLTLSPLHSVDTLSRYTQSISPETEARLRGRTKCRGLSVGRTLTLSRHTQSIHSVDQPGD